MVTPPFEYHREDAHRRIRVTARRTLNATELIAVVDRQLLEGTWDYGTLYDLRLVDGATSREDAMTVEGHVSHLAASHGRRGPVALVTRASRMIGAGTAYASASQRGGRSVEIFWDVDDAEAWLAVMT